MKLKSAMRNLKHQKEWLGVSWGELFSLIREKTIEFPDIIIQSFETYRDHVEIDDNSDRDQ